MTTFSLRASEELARRLTSSRMRSWLEDFLRDPHVLPSDPGAGYGRVSLTLQENTVNAAAAHCQCQVSSVLRRIAVERLGVVQAASSQDNSGTQTANLRSSAVPANRVSQPTALVALLVYAVFWILFIGSWFFFKSRKGNAASTTT